MIVNNATRRPVLALCCALAVASASPCLAKTDSGCEWALQVPAEQGLACQAATQSADGRWLGVAGGAPLTLRIYSLLPAPVLAATHPVALLTGLVASGVHAVFSAQHRHSLVVGLDDLPELWELNLNPAAEPIHDGLVHDYRMGEAIAKRGFLGVRRTPLRKPVRVLGTDAPGTHVFTVPTDQPLRVEVINLDVRRAIATFPVPQGVQVQPAQLRVCQGSSAVALGTYEQGQPWIVAARMPWPTVSGCDD